MAYNNMRREAGTAPSHARRNRTNKTSSAGKLYGKSFTTDESVLDRLVAGRASKLSGFRLSISIYYEGS